QAHFEREPAPREFANRKKPFAQNELAGPKKPFTPREFSSRKAPSQDERGQRAFPSRKSPSQHDGGQRAFSSATRPLQSERGPGPRHDDLDRPWKERSRSAIERRVATNSARPSADR